MKIRSLLIAVVVLAVAGCDSLFGPDGWIQDWSVNRKQPGIYQTVGTFRALRKEVKFDGIFAIPHEHYKLEREVNVGSDSVHVVIRAVETQVPEDSVAGAFGFELVLGDFDSGTGYTFVGTLEGTDAEPFVAMTDINFLY